MNRERRKKVVAEARIRMVDDNCNDPMCRCCANHTVTMTDLIDAFEELSMDIEDEIADPGGALLRLAWSAFQDNPKNGGAVDRDYKAVLKAMGGGTRH